MSVIFEPVLSGEITPLAYAICLLAAFLCGIIAAVAASYRTHVTKSFAVSLILLPAIVATVITMVNGNIGTGVAVAGAFSLVRFRSVAGKARDIVSIFLAMTAGLACAAGYVGIAILFTVIVCAAMMIVSHIPMGDDRALNLGITVPESLCFSTEFDDLFGEYTKSHRLIKVKTTNMGSLYKLSYKIELKDRKRTQEFIDKLRCRNGNLEILISESDGGEEL